MSTFHLILHNTNYAVPRRSVFELLDSRRDLLDATDYTVQSCVPVDVFHAFIDSLRNHTTLTVTKSNAPFLVVLANEFGLEDLRADCAHFTGDSVAAMADRLSQLEHNLSSSLTPIGLLEREVENVVERLSVLESQLAFMRKKWPGFESKLQELNYEALVSELRVGLKEKLGIRNGGDGPGDATGASGETNLWRAANQGMPNESAMPFSAKWSLSSSYAGGGGARE
jgi:hypothetical protein